MRFRSKKLPYGRTVNPNQAMFSIPIGMIKKLQRATYLKSDTRKALSWYCYSLRQSPSYCCHNRSRQWQFRWEVSENLPYSPDLAPSDFIIFYKLEFLGGKRFNSDDDLKHTVNTWLTKLAADDYKDGILKLVDRYDKCLYVGGYHVEK